MIGDRLKPAHADDLGIAAVDLFAGTALAMFVMFVIYMWLHQDPVSECFVRYQDHAGRVFEQRRDAFLEKPRFTFHQTQLVLNESWLSFEPCLWEFPATKQEQLRRLFEQLVPNEFRGCVASIRIEGHADRKPFSIASCVRAHPDRARDFSRIGPWEDNTQLSQNRARAVFEVLRQLPFVKTMWTEHRVHIGGYGDSWPLGDDPASALNRRVELHLTFHDTRAATLASKRVDTASNSPGPR